MQTTFIDSLAWWGVLAVTIALLGLMTEAGFRLGRGQLRRRAEAERAASGERDEDEAQVQKESSQVGVLVAALLGLLGLLLAFSFSIVESRFSARKRLVLEEANAIGTTYLRAGMLPEPHAARVRRLLHRYVVLRSTSGLEPEELPRVLARSERLHSGLWREAEAAAAQNPESEMTALFVDSLNDVIDLHEARVTISLYYRLPDVILGTLYLIALLGMGLMGYGAGLTRARLPIPTLATVTVISLVLLLVVELDRPWQRIFRVNQQSMRDLIEMIEDEERRRALASARGDAGAL